MLKMKKALMGLTAATLGLVVSVAYADTVTIVGAGASFPDPIYKTWAHHYQGLTDVRINYQSIGSGGGIAQIKRRTVDFGASDAPMEAKELEESNLIQLPMVIGGVVPVFNLAGIEPGQLKLTGQVLADIYLGNITEWNDKAIADLNPDMELPRRSIIPVRRADGSGTTWLFTNYLAKVSETWREKVGSGTAVSWPVGIGARGNEGVSRNVQQFNGAIGYVEYAYALQNKMPYAQLQNRAGKFVAPTIKTFQAAAEHAEWDKAPGYYMVLTDQPGDHTWPITGASFILLQKNQQDAGKAVVMLKFFEWCYKHGQKMAEELHYVPMPKNVVEMIEKTWAEELRSDGKPVWQVSKKTPTTRPDSR